MRILSPSAPQLLSTLLVLSSATLSSAQSTTPAPAGTHATDKVNQHPLTSITAETGFGGAMFKMALHEEHPFVFYNTSKQGNDRFSGITVDIAKMLCEHLDCELEFIIASETNPTSAEEALKAIGAGMPVGSTHVADIAGGALHITPNRSAYVHFTLPYFDTGYVTIVKTPASKAYNLFAFLEPFQGNLWASLIVEMLVMAVVFAIMESPWATVEEETDVVDGHVASFLDCVYWSLSALTCTLDKAPKSWGGKLAMLAHGWFMLIIIASYTANLATFLTTAVITPEVTGWPDVTAGGTSLKMAIPKGLSHDDFLAFEKGHYNYQFNVAAETNTWEESIVAVEQGNADVTFHDEAMVQYYMLNQMTLSTTGASACPIMMVGKRFAPTGYGFAFGVDSTAFLPFSQAILTLKENGEITKLVESYGVGTSKAEAAISSLCAVTATASMDFTEFHGLFIMTGAITGAGLIVNALQKFAASKDEGGAKVANMDGATVTDPAVEAALKAGIEAALAESLDAAFKAGLEVGMKEALKHLPPVAGKASQESNNMVQEFPQPSEP